jgi:hypothetical protein
MSTSAAMIPVTIDNAHATLWIEGTPRYNDRPTATIGAFSCHDRISGIGVIRECERIARDHHRTYMVGPMDGTTWHKYRFVVESDGSPPFLMEPVNPPEYPAIFEAAGYAVIAQYQSALAHKQTITPSLSFAAKLERNQITVRSFSMDNARVDLHKIFTLSIDRFAQNFLYTPITEEQFLGLYLPLIDKLDPDYILMAEDPSGTPLGFVFGIPHYAQGAHPSSLIFKTYASRYPGLGSYLGDTLHHRAFAAGYDTAIHALMFDDNRSLTYSRKYGSPFRRYALFGKELS